MVMAADLDRPVAGIGHRQGDRGAAGIQLDLAGRGDDFAGNHDTAPYSFVVMPGLDPSIFGQAGKDPRIRSEGDGVSLYTPPITGSGCARSPAWCRRGRRSEEHTSELQSLMRISYAVFCLKKKTRK